MYQSHFKFKQPPFRTITGFSGDFLVPYHQDVFNLLKEKSQWRELSGSLQRRTAAGPLQRCAEGQPSGAIAINAFPKLSASSLLYKLNPGTKESKSRIQAVDAVLHQWQGGKTATKPRSSVTRKR